MLDLKSWIEMQRMLEETLRPYMEMLGLELYIDKVILYPGDCEDNTCVDYVWRIKCRDIEVCERLREEIRKQSGGQSEQ